MNVKTFALVLFCVCLITGAHQAGGQMLVEDPGVLAKEIEAVFNQISMIQNQMTQIDQMAKQLTTIPTSMSGTIMQPFKDMQSVAQNLTGIGTMGQGILSNFQQNYNPSSFLTGTNMSGDMASYAQKSAQWSTDFSNQLNNIMSFGPKLNTSAQSNLAAVQQSLSSSDSAPGILAATQSGNEILGTLAQQLSTLQQTTYQGQILQVQMAAAQNGSNKTYKGLVTQFFSNAGSNENSDGSSTGGTQNTPWVNPNDAPDTSQ